MEYKLLSTVLKYVSSNLIGETIEETLNENNISAKSIYILFPDRFDSISRV